MMVMLSLSARRSISAVHEPTHVYIRASNKAKEGVLPAPLIKSKVCAPLPRDVLVYTLARYPLCSINDELKYPVLTPS